MYMCLIIIVILVVNKEYVSELVMQVLIGLVWWINYYNNKTLE